MAFIPWDKHESKHSLKYSCWGLCLTIHYKIFGLTKVGVVGQGSTSPGSNRVHVIIYKKAPAEICQHIFVSNQAINYGPASFFYLLFLFI